MPASVEVQLVRLTAELRELQARDALLREQNRLLQERVELLEAYIEQLQRMLFGKRSEKMPNINDEVRRQISEEELTPELLGLDPDTPKKELDEARKHERRKRSRRG